MTTTAAMSTPSSQPDGGRHRDSTATSSPPKIDAGQHRADGEVLLFVAAIHGGKPLAVALVYGFGFCRKRVSAMAVSLGLRDPGNVAHAWSRLPKGGGGVSTSQNRER